jgi:DNA repair ATPase RecN
MTETLKECLDISDGAHFFRGDLHIHSFGASHDVKDVGMTPSAIVETAARENLAVIAVADHNEISNVQESVRYGEAAGVVVIPAVELSTTEGHLLCYFSSVDALSAFYARLDIADRGTQNSRCRTAMHGCLDLVQQIGGFAILAHVDAGNGLETNYPGGSPHKADIICHAALVGIELSSATSTVTYSSDDNDATRAQIGRQRIEKLALGERQYLARILSSDSHTLNALGRNANRDRKLTRYKMAAPSFEGLRHALYEGDSRIRLEDEVPTSTPFVLGLKFGGGFLSEQAIHFSRNLNCIIGGRGTGKSTTFEAVRCLTSGPVADVVDSEVWPNELHIFWQDEAGQQHSLVRSIGESVTNLDDPIDGPVEFDIDSFGQGEAAHVREESKKDPLALMKYLDTFTLVSRFIHEEKESIDVLKNLWTEVQKAEQNVAQIIPTQRTLSVTQQQLKAFEAANGSEVIKLQRQLATEKAKKESLESQLAGIKASIAQGSIADEILMLRSVVDGDGISIGIDEANQIAIAVDEFEEAVIQATAQVEKAFEKLNTLTKQSTATWKAKERPVQEDVERKRAELEAKGVKLDMAHISKLTGEEARLEKLLKTLRTWEPHLKQKKLQYASALNQRWEKRKAVASTRQQYAIKASRALAEVLSDLQVKLQYTESGYSESAVEIIAGALGWRTVNYPKARTIVEQVTVPGLLTSIQRNKPEALTEIEIDGAQLFAVVEAKQILEKLGEPAVRAALEHCDVDDLPKLTVTKRVDGSSAPRFVKRDFGQLSLGQQQSVLLALILSSDSKRPLIIDQPEDNLDSEFIFQTFVPVLRRAKERRQVIIVTHNANIAVLGDAEQLIVFKSNSDHSKIVARGSIDDIQAKDAACRILEGAREAFTRRAKIYGVA